MLRASAQSLPSAAASNCSDLREINDAKVANIMSYLEEIMPPMQGGMFGSGDAALHRSMTFDDAQPLPFSFGSPSPSAPRMAAMPSSMSIASGITTLANENQVYSGIKGKIDALRSTCDTLQKENASLHTKVMEDRKKYDAAVAQLRETAKKELDEALTALHTANRKHTEQLNKALLEKDAVTRALETMTHKYKLEMSAKEQERQNLESAHAAALSQAKGKWMMQEKASREAWKEKELKEMKKTTLSTLQPDIELLIKKQKAEKVRLEEEFQSELHRRDKMLADKEQAFEELKAKVQSMAENRVIQERQLADERAREECNRIRRLMEEERISAEKKREVQQELFDEKEKMFKMDIRKLEAELFELRRQQLEGTAQFREAVSSEVAKLSSSQEEVLKQRKAQLDDELRAEKDRIIKANAEYLKRREEEIRARSKSDLDASVAQIHQRMDDAYINKVKEMKDGEKLLRDRISRLERTVEQLETDLEVTKGQLKTSLESIRQKDESIVCLQRDVKAARDARESLEEMQEKEFDQRIRFLDSQWQQRLRQIETEKVDCVNELTHKFTVAERAWELQRMQLENELHTVDQRYNTQLSGINDKVLVTVASKETIIRQQNERIAALESTIRERELALERHKSLLD